LNTVRLASQVGICNTGKGKEGTKPRITEARYTMKRLAK
jgi:hypothetical protein